MTLESKVVSGEQLVYMAGKLQGTNPPNFVTFTVYNDTTTDHPGKHVVRLWANHRATSFCALADSLEAAREIIPQHHFFCMNRAAGDDPVIVETWI